MKKCTKCGEIKVLDLFFRHSQSVDGRRPDCKVCRSRLQKLYVLKNKERVARTTRNGALRRQYGINEDQYKYLMEVQKGRCAICNSVPSKKALDIDHNHLTGLVRGLLCFTCNSALGKFRGDMGIELLQKAINYLLRTDGQKIIGISSNKAG